MRSEPIVSATNVDVFYGSLQALWNVSFFVDDGEMVCLLGVNGSGKSTCLKAVCGLIRARTGEITLSGKRINDLQTDQIVDRGLVLVPERRRLFPYLTVKENLLVAATPKRARKLEKERLDLVYSLFPKLYERQSQLSYSLSGGEQQMVSIGRGLMSNPILLMLDEPFLGLSPRVRDEVSVALTQLNQGGLAILFIEQSLVASAAISHRAYILDAGRVVWNGSSTDLMADRATTEAYFGFKANVSGSERSPTCS
ncbi:MAG: ABC transporter ATP-binding protein [Dehalococcoidia bacterium]